VAIQLVESRVALSFRELVTITLHLKEMKPNRNGGQNSVLKGNILVKRDMWGHTSLGYHDAWAGRQVPAFRGNPLSPCSGQEDD
jgi:hypothetical protein